MPWIRACRGSGSRKGKWTMFENSIEKIIGGNALRVMEQVLK